MRVTLYVTPWCPLRNEAKALAESWINAQLASAFSLRLPHRTIPAIVVEEDGEEPVVLDAEKPEDMTLDRIVRDYQAARAALADQVVEPDPRDVLVQALVARVGAPTPEELAAARKKLITGTERME